MVTICRAVGVEGGGAGAGKEEEQDPAWLDAVAVIRHHLVTILSLETLPFHAVICGDEASGVL